MTISYGDKRGYVLEGDDLNTFKDGLAIDLFGITTAKAIRKKICIDCKKPMKSFENKFEMKEWAISGLCNSCFDRNTGGQ